MRMVDIAVVLFVVSAAAMSFQDEQTQSLKNAIGDDMLPSRFYGLGTDVESVESRR